MASDGLRRTEDNFSLWYLMSNIGIYAGLQYWFWESPTQEQWIMAYLFIEATFLFLFTFWFPALPWPVSTFAHLVYDHRRKYAPFLIALGYLYVTSFLLDYIGSESYGIRTFCFIVATWTFAIPFIHFLEQRYREMIGISLLPEKNGEENPLYTLHAA